MKSQPVLVRKIEQKDNYTFVIEWSDGVISAYRLGELQRQCPCASCVDENTGQRINDGKNCNPDVRAVRIVSTGRYALRIQFTSGCSNGIYGFDMLRKLSYA